MLTSLNAIERVRSLATPPCNRYGMPVADGLRMIKHEGLVMAR